MCVCVCVLNIHIYITYNVCGWCGVMRARARVCVCVCVRACMFVSIIFNLRKSQKNRKFEVEDEEPFEYFFFT